MSGITMLMFNMLWVLLNEDLTEWVALEPSRVRSISQIFTWSTHEYLPKGLTSNQSITGMFTIIQPVLFSSICYLLYFILIVYAIDTLPELFLLVCLIWLIFVGDVCIVFSLKLIWIQRGLPLCKNTAYADRKIIVCSVGFLPHKSSLP